VLNSHIKSVAGSETTASSLASFINMMMRHPDIYAKDIKLAVAMELPYLTACIEENLRIFPPAPIGFLRTIQKGGDVIDGNVIPGGVS